jgi:hypothetical protein
MHLRDNSAPAMLVRNAILDRPTLQTPKEIHVGKLLHFLHIGGLGYLFVVEQNPRWALLVWQLLANERNIVTEEISILRMTAHRSVAYPAWIELPL